MKPLPEKITTLKIDNIRWSVSEEKVCVYDDEAQTKRPMQDRTAVVTRKRAHSEMASEDGASPPMTPDSNYNARKRRKLDETRDAPLKTKEKSGLSAMMEDERGLNTEMLNMLHNISAKQTEQTNEIAALKNATKASPAKLSIDRVCMHLSLNNCTQTQHNHR